jgi:hypothetical protein
MSRYLSAVAFDVFDVLNAALCTLQGLRSAAFAFGPN